MEMKVLPALALPAVLVLGIAYTATHLVDGPPPSTQASARGIVWGGLTFVDRAEFARWLRSRGVPYRVWAQRHPARAGIALRRQADRPARRAAHVNGAGHRSNWAPVGLGGAVALILALVGLLVHRHRSGKPRTRRRLPGEQFGVAARRVIAAEAGRARLLVRRPIVAALTSASFARSAGLTTLRTAPVAAGGARLMLRRGTMRLRSLVRSAALLVWHRRGELAWYVASALFVTGASLVVTAWA